MDPIFWILVITWMVQRGVTDGMYAFRGKPNPRYELKKAKALAAGQAAPEQHRYGGKEWFADLLSDAMAANTEKRRQKAAAKAQPLDDMVDVVREPRPERVYDPNNSRNCPECKGEVVLDGRPCPRCLAERQRRNAEWEANGGLDQIANPRPKDLNAQDSPRLVNPARAVVSTADRPIRPAKRCSYGGPETQFGKGKGQCGSDAAPDSFFCPPHRAEVAKVNQATAALCSHVENGQRCRNLRTNVGDSQQRYGRCSQHTSTPDVRPDAQIIQFPNIKKIEKEITMANSEAAGLTTAIAFAEAAASAHQSFATAGAEGYVGALQRGDMDGEPVDTAREAMEASGIAADKWNAHKATLEAQLNIKEAYQAQPGAANKEYLLNG
ncbi:hypothetical protein ACGF3C_02185 [Micromonospora sp. NPDC047762]|uniref:hypothetical protein n=1 Tax=Micromonospora sp. NPDC047762 TaxID=3364255 RepID=UPI00371734AE